MKFVSNFLFKTKNNEHGGVLILVAFAMVVILGMAVIAIDVGSLYQTRRQAVNAADAAALAGAQEIVRAKQDKVTSDAGVRERVSGVVEDYLGYHDTDLIRVTEQDGSPIGANSKTVKVAADKEASLFFAPAFSSLAGSNLTGSSDVGAVATARLEFITDPTSMRPFAISKDRWDELSEEDVFDLIASFTDSAADWGAGNWGLVNFIGPGAGPGGGESYPDWIRYGYQGGLPEDNIIYTAPSTRLAAQPCKNALESIIGDEIIIPIIDPVEGENLPDGSKRIKIVGFSTIEIKSVGFPPNMKVQAQIIKHSYNIANESSDDTVYDFGLETAFLVE